jgi:hypothetical protein
MHNPGEYNIRQGIGGISNRKGGMTYMKIRTVLSVFAAVAVAAFMAGCGSSSSGGGGGDEGSMTQNEALYLVGSLQSAAEYAQSTGNYTPTASVGADALKTVQCTTTPPISCTFNVPIDAGINCTAGGRIQVLGSITGSMTDGTGMLQIGATETISDWQCVTGFIVNGDPYISLTGTFSFMNYALSTQHQLTLTGGWKWGTTAAESCQLHLVIDIDDSGAGSITGDVCGYEVNVST